MHREFTPEHLRRHHCRSAVVGTLHCNFDRSIGRRQEVQIRAGDTQRAAISVGMLHDEVEGKTSHRDVRPVSKFHYRAADGRADELA